MELIAYRCTAAGVRGRMLEWVSRRGVEIYIDLRRDEFGAIRVARRNERNIGVKEESKSREDKYVAL